MSSKHEMTENGELYISHIEAKKRFKVSRKQLNEWSAAGKVRLIQREMTRMPHQLMNDNQLELHFYHAGDIEKAVNLC
ncbi:MAG: hypothetical protein KA419_20405 [Acidobacteria bacterium]|jgi:hypothetical protein|nr:hypothetical protein [Acidobacteriota bacterium]